MQLKLKLAVAAIGWIFVVSTSRAEDFIVAPPYTTGDVSLVSPSGLRVATVTMKGSRKVVVIDGKEGPLVDDVLSAAVIIEQRESPVGGGLTQDVRWQGPVAFSFDGQRHAYAAREGADVMVIVDGKEIFRAPFTPSQPVVSHLRFSPAGKHVLFLTTTTDTMNSSCLVVDGQKQPATQSGAFPIFAPADAHYAYAADRPGIPGEKPFVIVDGKEAPFTGTRLRYTSGGRLVCVSKSMEKETLLVDGKPLVEASRISYYTVSPAGDRIATVAMSPGDAKRSLYLDDKIVPEADGVGRVTFSPDGKRWAAECYQSPAVWVVIDGQAGQKYNGVADLKWTADSSKAIYVATAGNKQFVVANNQEEFGGQVMRVRPVLSRTGGHYAYAVGENLGAISVVYDGKGFEPGPDVMDITLSPDGSRYGYFGKTDLMANALFLDGKTVAAVAGDYKAILFSPDNKHVAVIAQPVGKPFSLLIDEEFVPLPKADALTLLTFSPDSQHVFMRGNVVNEKGQIVFRLFMDNKPVADFDLYSRNWPSLLLWEFREDGSVDFIGGDPIGSKPGPAKRVNIKPSASGTSIASLATDAKAAQAAAEQAAKDAQAAKQKADADALAAREQAAADAKAAREQAVADKKAAREAALKEAAEKRAKARADAEAAKAAKQGK